MFRQLSFIDEPETAPYVRYSATSKAAAEAIIPKRQSQCERIYDYMKRCGSYGATNDEISKELGICENSIHPRRRELEKAGLVENTYRTRMTRNGREAEIWVAK